MADERITPEHLRLEENALKEIPLEKWGPYVSERQWGTVREDYSENGDAWNYFPHDHARSRAYKWGEDGIAGISDIFQNLCFAFAFWNGKDPILKERLFGLANNEGNHGEDVKELYYYLDNVPTHYYMKYLYKYPHNAYPYEELVEKNKSRSKQEPEFELLDTGIFNNDEYFDIYLEYAKNNSEDILIRIEINNRSEKSASLTILPTLWFYNRWQYGGLKSIPSIEKVNDTIVKASHERLGDYFLAFQKPAHLLFTDNETNFEKLYKKPNRSDFVKDAFHEAIINGKDLDKLEMRSRGTKCAIVYNVNLAGKSKTTFYLRLANHQSELLSIDEMDKLFNKRNVESDDFYNSILHSVENEDLKNIARQSWAGLLWNKQYYHYDIERWLNKSDGITPISNDRLNGRNHDWIYLKNQDVISMPDKWEYPWYASWDTAFHSICMASIDPVFAKNQLILLMREWYMNPEGQLPAYEWNFSDVNPPVHAFAALKVYEIEKSMKGTGDLDFLKRVFQKLIINFTWWANRKDENGNNVFEGGFLGLDNIGVFNRSEQLPDEIVLEQADGTSWMGMYALNMMDIALELSMTDKSYEDAAIKFYEHFVLIAEALNEMGLWNEEDQFFYDILSLNGRNPFPLKVRSIVGFAPLFAASIINKRNLDKLDDFNKRINWFRQYRIDNHKFLPVEEKSSSNDLLLSMVHPERLTALLQRLIDESEFLSEHGIRSVSKYYLENPYMLQFDGIKNEVQYSPGDSPTGLYGGNSNWRGPVWIPINYLLISTLEKYGDFYGDSFKIEYPKGSGLKISLTEIAEHIRDSIIQIFTKNDQCKRKVFGSYQWFYEKEENTDLILFHEYFHGDDGHGLGASHQTGWTALISDLITKKTT